MARILFEGKTINTSDELPTVRTQAPEFVLTNTELKDITLSDFSGKNVLLYVLPSIDIPVGAEPVRQFNKLATELLNTQVLCVSADLPFAQERFSRSEDLSNIILASEYRHASFGDTYGVRIVDGPLQGLLSKAVIIIDPDDKITYTEQVVDINAAPDYDAVRQALQ